MDILEERAKVEKREITQKRNNFVGRGKDILDIKSAQEDLIHHPGTTTNNFNEEAQPDMEMDGSAKFEEDNGSLVVEEDYVQFEPRYKEEEPGYEEEDATVAVYGDSELIPISSGGG